jgi:DUF4097 and DUF4098 domain-containing protein YvlB
MKAHRLARTLASLLSTCALAGAASGCFVSLSAGSRSDSFSHQTEREEVHALALSPGQKLVLQGSSGDIRVSASSDGRSELRALVRGWGRNHEEAEAVLARYRVEVEQDAAGARVRLVGEPLEVHGRSMNATLSADVEYVASVPAGTALEALTSAGDIEARGPLGATRLVTQYGDVGAEDVRGSLDASSGSGDVRAARVEGDVIALSSEYGDVRLEEGAAAGNVACTSGSGDVDVERTRGRAIELATSYGDLDARDLEGELRARSGSGSVRICGARGAIDADSSYGGVEIEGILAGLRASAGSGDVRVRALPGSRVDPAWSLTSSYGSVTLSVPSDFACELDARTSFGSVKSDFSLLTEAGERENDSALRGQVGAGGGRVTLASGSGNVALKKL